jgi:hypothetical protein
MDRIDNISPPTGLSPKAKYFEEVGDTCLNVDACIELVRSADTWQARAIYKAFRKRLATNDAAGLTAEKARENAFFDGLHDLGIQTPMMNISGNI